MAFIDLRNLHKSFARQRVLRGVSLEIEKGEGLVVIAVNAEAVLYDEPTTGLDPIRADVINELILKLQRELNITHIVVTHDMASAFKVGRRIVMLHEGQLIFDGTPKEIQRSDDPRVK